MSLPFSLTRVLVTLLPAFVFAGCAAQGFDEFLDGTPVLGEEIVQVDLGETVDLADIKRQLVVNVGDRVLFRLGSNGLDDRSRAALDKQAEFLNQHPSVRLIVEGHADERGTRAFNIGLALRRANAVKDYLIGAGVSTRRLKVVSFGKERPIAPCSKERCWRLNRRSVIVIRDEEESAS